MALAPGTRLGVYEQGIIHRDLKPVNIKVRSDGTVKVDAHLRLRPPPWNDAPAPTRPGTAAAVRKDPDSPHLLVPQ